MRVIHLGTTNNILTRRRRRLPHGVLGSGRFRYLPSSGPEAVAPLPACTLAIGVASVVDFLEVRAPQKCSQRASLCNSRRPASPDTRAATTCPNSNDAARAMCCKSALGLRYLNWTPSATKTPSPEHDVNLKRCEGCDKNELYPAKDNQSPGKWHGSFSIFLCCLRGGDVM